MYKPDEKMRSLQLKCVEIVESIDAFCRKHNIDYALCGGSAIGAHLYKGFIPWDDDMDLMMTRKNYKKFLRLWNKEAQKYELHHYTKIDNGGAMFAKVVDPNTTLVESYESITTKPSGVFVDITVFDYCSGKLLSELKRKIAMFCWLVRTENLGNKSKIGYIHFFASLPTFLRVAVFKFAEWVISLSFGNPQKVQEYWAMDGDSNLVQYPKELFESYTEAEFEGKRFKTLKDNYTYLTVAYNRTDFRLPEEEQYPHHFNVFMDLELPYREYILRQEEKE